MIEELFSALIPVFIFGLIGVVCRYSGPPEEDTKFEDMCK